MLARAYRAKNPTASPEKFARYTLCDPFHKHEHWIAAVEGGQVVSALKIFRRPVSYRGRQYEMAGIGNVGTDPQYQGRGFATRLLREAIRYMENERFDFSILYTGSPGFYARLGWQGISQTRYELTRWSWSADLGSWQVRGMEQGDLPTVGALYDSRVRPFGVAVVRNEEYWRSWVMDFAMGDPARQALVAVRSGQVLAYALVRHRSGVCSVIEGGCVAGCLDGLAAILADATGNASAVQVPLMPDLIALVQQSGSEVREVSVPAGMVRFTGERLDLSGAGFILTSADAF